MIHGISNNDRMKAGGIEFQYRVVDSSQIKDAPLAGMQSSGGNEELLVGDSEGGIKVNHFRRIKNEPGFMEAYASGFSDYLARVNPNQTLMGGFYGGMSERAEAANAVSMPNELFANISNSSSGVLPQSPEQYAMLQQIKQETASSPYYGIDNFSILNNIMNNRPNVPYGMETSGNVEWPQITSDPNIIKLMQGDMSSVRMSNPEELRNLIAQLGNLKKEYGSNVGQIESMVGTLTEHLQQLESEKRELESARNGQVQQFNQEQSRLQQLNAKKQQLTAQSQQLAQQKTALTTQITSLKEGIASMSASVTSMEAEAAALSANPLTAAAGAAMLSQVAALKAQIAMMQAQMAQSQAQLQQTEVQIQQTTAQLQQTDQAIAQSQQNLQNIRSSIEQIDQKLVAVNQQIAQISSQINQGLNLIVERKTNMAMCDVRSNNLNSYGNIYSSLKGDKNGPTDSNGFLNQMRMGGGASNIMNTITGIANLFGFGGVSGGGLLGGLFG